MIVLHINCVYPKGSTGKITQVIHEARIKRGEESLVCYGRGKRVRSECVYKVSTELQAKMNVVFSRMTGIAYGGCYLSTCRLISIIKRLKVDVVHLQCINGSFVNIYNLVNWLKKHDIPTVLTLHAEFMYTANCGHALECEKWKTGCNHCPRWYRETKSLIGDRTAISFAKMQKAFEGFDKKLVIASVSPWLMDRAKQSAILKGKENICIYNGLDTSVFCYRSEEKLRQTLCQPGEYLVLHVTAFFSDCEDHLKGGIWLLRLAEQMKGQPIRFVVIGPYRVDTTLPPNVILLNNIENQKLLASYYSAADLTLLLSQRETFSMIVAESLCCGTPVVGFKAGAPEQIAMASYSSFVDQGDLVGMKRETEKWLSKDLDKKQIAEEAKDVYSSQKMIDSYEEVYRRLYEGYK